MMWKAHDDKKLAQAGNGKDHSMQGNVYYANWYDRYQIKFIVQKQIKPLGHNVKGFLYKLQKKFQFRVWMSRNNETQFL